jgi:hypothetical protein
VSGNDHQWTRSGLSPRQTVRCRVTGHRGRFGVEVSVIVPAFDALAFIDFVNLTDGPEHPRPEDFPAVGCEFDAIVLDFMPRGELRLAALTSQGPCPRT